MFCMEVRKHLVFKVLLKRPQYLVLRANPDAGRAPVGCRSGAGRVPVGRR